MTIFVAKVFVYLFGAGVCFGFLDFVFGLLVGFFGGFFGCFFGCVFSVVVVIRI